MPLLKAAGTAVSAAALCLCLVIGAAYGDITESRLMPGDSSARSYFGYASGIGGDYAVIGSAGDDYNPDSPGAVYVFRREGEVRTEEAKLSAPDDDGYDSFGKAIGISGDYIVVGASGDDDRGNSAGAAYIFVRENGAWSLQAKLTASDAAAYDGFGNSAGVSGGCVIVGASGRDGSAVNTGAACIFRRNGAVWTQEAKLTAPDAAVRDLFGFSVGIAGDYIVCGAPGDDGGGSSAGSAYIFRREGSAWVCETKLAPGDPEAADAFGEAVAIRGDYAIAGAWGGDDKGRASGAAYIFRREGAAWTQYAKLLAGDGQAYSQLGKSVSIADGYALAGVPFHDGAAGADTGAAYIYAFVRQGDTEPPSVPQNATAAEISAVPCCRVAVSWDASSDNTGVKEYRVFRNGDAAATVTGTAWTDTAASPLTAYTYTVAACDDAGNCSAESGPASVTTSNDIILSLDQKISISTDGIFVDEPEYITIKVNIFYDTSENIPSVILQRTDAEGNPIMPEGELTDDGNLDNGDEIAGDGVFTIKKRFLSSAEEIIYLRIFVTQNELFKASDVFSVEVFTRLSDNDFNAVLSLQTDAMENYTGLSESLGREAARDAVLFQIEQSPIVLQAGISESGYGIWILYTFGIVGGLNFDMPDNYNENSLSASETDKIDRKGTSVPFVKKSSQTRSEKEKIGNRKAIILDAFNWEFGSADAAPYIYQILSDSVCPKFDITLLIDSQVTVDIVRTLYQYGTIFMFTHGDIYYDGLFGFWREKWEWRLSGDQVLFLTGQEVIVADKSIYEIDLRKGRLSVITHKDVTYYAILPSFIRYYAENNYPESLVLMNVCFSTFNDSMANAFLDQGAKTYLGYSKEISALFSRAISIYFLERFVLDPDITNTGQAFIPNQIDYTTGAVFELRGSEKLELPSSGLENGGFERGDLGDWKGWGDKRVLRQIGEFGPVNGQSFGLISTGLGFSTASGYIRQTICLPPDARTLEFHWNFNSEEFIEWCGWEDYQDYFKVFVLTSEGIHTLFSRNIDGLCGSIVPSSLKFDQSSGICIPSDGYLSPANDCMVWSTGWQRESVDISQIAEANHGKPVTLQFSVGDVGDSIFDSAVLLDDIRIVTEP